MPKGDHDNSQRLGICHRIINLLMNTLIGQGFKRVTTLGRAACIESNEVPVEDSLRNLKNTVWSSDSNGVGALSPEIVIEFKHVEGTENSTQVQKLDSPVNFPKKNGPIVTDDRALLLPKKEVKMKERRHSEAATSRSVVPPPEKTDAAVRIKGPREWESPAATWGRGPKSMVSTGDTEKYKNKEKNIDTETRPSVTEIAQTKTKPLIHPRPLLMSVPSNINEKADEFIRSRKEAMIRHHSSEPKKF